MRTIAGALLLIAASICLGASVIAEKLPNMSSGSQGITYLAAMILGPLGFILLFLGLALDSNAESQPTPRWLWVTLLVVVLGIPTLLAIAFFLPSSGKDAAPAINRANERHMDQPSEESNDSAPARE